MAMTMPISSARRSQLLVNLPLLNTLSGRVAGGVAFTRASSQWYQDDAGVWRQAASGVPAFNSKGILLEPASTNKCTCYGVIPTDSPVARGNGSNLAKGNIYTIVSRATLDYTTCGASSNALGTTFLCTSAGALGPGDQVNLIQYAVGTKSYYSAGAWAQNHTNMTLSGDTAAALTTVDDTAALTAAGLLGICPSGKVYKLDNSAGTSASFLSVQGNPGNTNLHSMSCFCRVGNGVARLDFNNFTASVTTASPTYVLLKKENATPPNSGAIPIGVTVNAGQVIYFVLPQLEELPFTTSPMPALGATATRAAMLLSFSAAGNIKKNDFTVYFEYTPLLASASAAFRLLTLYSDNNNLLRISHLTNATLYMTKIIGGVNSEFNPGCVGIPGVTIKIAARVSSVSGMALFFNGALKGSNTNTTNVPMVSVQIGYQATGAQLPEGYIRNLRIYRRPLSDAQCIAMTT